MPEGSTATSQAHRLRPWRLLWVVLALASFLLLTGLDRAVGSEPAATASRVDCEPNLVLLGGATVCTATVTADSPTSPTGTVRFSPDGEGDFPEGRDRCTLVESGSDQARCAVVYVPSGLGAQTISVAYEGDPAHGGSFGAVPLIAEPLGGRNLTRTDLACEPATVVLFGRAACTATVTDISGSPSTPGGEAILLAEGPGGFGSGCVLVPAPAPDDVRQRTCSFDYVPREVGSGVHPIRVVYTGGAQHGPSQAQALVNVKSPPHPTRTAVSCAPERLPVGQKATCTATVFDTSPDPSAPGGRVRFESHGSGGLADWSCARAGADRISCRVTYVPRAGAAGYVVTALYRPNAKHLPSEGSARLQILVVPNTTFTRAPNKETTRRNATFRFASDVSGSGFRCKVDSRPRRRCGSPLRLRNLEPGRHVLRVSAISADGLVEKVPAVYGWMIGERR